MNKIKSVEINVDLEAVRSAATNAPTLADVALTIPHVNPKVLNMEDDCFIYRVQRKPIKDSVKLSTPSTLSCVAIQDIPVDTLAKNVTDGCITVNGNIDVPVEGGKAVSLEEAFFVDRETAKEVAKILTEVEYDKATAVKEEAEMAENFLKEQLDEERF